MARYRIKQPKPKNILSAVHTYNALKGQGIEIFFNMKKGKVFVEDYFVNINNDRVVKLSTVENGNRLERITAEYIAHEIQRAGKNEMLLRTQGKANRKEQKKLHKTQKKESRVRQPNN